MEIRQFAINIPQAGLDDWAERLAATSWPGERSFPPAAYGGDVGDAFDVVAPSLPGYGFSGKVVERGMSDTRIAGMRHTPMMEGLGYRASVKECGVWKFGSLP